MKKARIAVLTVCAAAAIVIVAATPAVAAEQAQIANPPHDGAIAQQAEVNHDAVQQAVQADQDGGDADLGDQPGDVNDDAENHEPTPEPVEPPSTITTPTPPPSNPETGSVEPTPTSNGGRRQLAYTGGNEMLYMVLGTLFGLAGTGLLVGTVLSRKNK